MATISTYTLVAIRQDYLKGFSVKHLADKYNVSTSTIRKYTKQECLLLEESYIATNRPLREITLEEYDELNYYILSGIPLKDIEDLTGLTPNAIRSYGYENLQYRLAIKNGQINPYKVSPPYTPSNIFEKYHYEPSQFAR